MRQPQDVTGPMTGDSACASGGAKGGTQRRKGRALGPLDTGPLDMFTLDREPMLLPTATTQYESDLGGNPFANVHAKPKPNRADVLSELKGKVNAASAPQPRASVSTKWMFGTRGFVVDDVAAFRPLSPSSRPTSPVGRLLVKKSGKKALTRDPYEQTPLLQDDKSRQHLTRLGPLKNWQSFVQGTEAEQERRTASGSQEGFGNPKALFSPARGGGKRRFVRAMNDGDDDQGQTGEDREETSWLLLRPSKTRVDRWLDAWWRRWFILVGVPCLIVRLHYRDIVSDPFQEQPPWNLPWPGEPTNSTSATIHAALARPWKSFVSASEAVTTRPIQLLAANVETLSHAQAFASSTFNTSSEAGGSHSGLKDPAQGRPPADDDLPVDANFYFFLFAYYGVYLAVALIFITKLFDLYRLNWWPSTLGGSVSYIMFWSLSLLVGFLLHHFDLDGLGRRSHANPRRKPREDESFDWERKTTWVLLAFFAMTLPALACFAKLRADRRNSYRRSLTAAQRTQVLLSLFLERSQQRMPRSYKRFLWFLLTLTLSLFVLLIGQAFATVYLSTLPHNNLDGLTYVWTWIATCNILNTASNWVLETQVRSRALVFVFRYYYFLVYHIFYRNLFARLRSPDQAFWIQLLSSSFVIFWYPLSMSKTFHRLLVWAFGVDKDWEEYAESLTAIASLVIWGTELGSSLVARIVIWWTFGLDVTNLGLNEFRDYPELVVACVWTSVHVLYQT
ncbi:hypothetical protein OIV83_002925 [Microbotryomycetes sp. JL201]|nr:hypothetical protein OIV83_002925 [Microbotryomycetes sp. JL201]